jgi:hypothetical protein
MTVNNLFLELDDCKSCPPYDVVTDENQAEIISHLASTHPGVGATAFVLAKRPNDERVSLQAIYDEAAPFLDQDFHTRFLRELDKLSWELNVYKHLRESGININPVQHTGPDFDTDLGYIECICVGQGEGDNEIPLPKVATIDKDGNIDGEIEFQSVPVDEMKLRVSSGFYDKQQKYKRYVERNYIDPTKPRIIAINWHCDGAAWMAGRGTIENDPAIQAIFGSGNRQITIDPTSGNVTDSRIAHVPFVRKRNGQDIDVGFFIRKITDDAERIDGVILNNGWPGSLSLDYTRVINNPMSSVSFDLEALSTASGFKASKNKQIGMIDLSPTASSTTV